MCYSVFADFGYVFLQLELPLKDKRRLSIFRPLTCFLIKRTGTVVVQECTCLANMLFDYPPMNILSH